MQSKIIKLFPTWGNRTTIFWYLKGCCNILKTVTFDHYQKFVTNIGWSVPGPGPETASGIGHWSQVSWGVRLIHLTHRQVSLENQFLWILLHNWISSTDLVELNLWKYLLLRWWWSILKILQQQTCKLFHCKMTKYFKLFQFSHVRIGMRRLCRQTGGQAMGSSS